MSFMWFIIGLAIGSSNVPSKPKDYSFQNDCTKGGGIVRTDPSSARGWTCKSPEPEKPNWVQR